MTTQEPTTQEATPATTQETATQERLKQDDGVPPQARNDTRTVMAVLGVAMALAVVFVAVMTSGTTSKGTDSPGATAASMATTAAGTPTAVAPIGQGATAAEGSSPHQMAGALRRDATIQCHAAQWDKCREDLEQSAKLDPEGDKIFQVQRLHHMAEQRNVGAN